ncbi:MAG TPA: metallophosphoesterase family protein, partial [bacterium]|nr:metallophosphoesterase family protein [bacterium]
KSQNYDLIIYGHTHKIDTRKEGKTLVINPGELGGWLTGRKTFVILDLASMKYRLAELD